LIGQLGGLPHLKLIVATFLIGLPVNSTILTITISDWLD
jgi:hypothetical protein